MKEYSAKVFWSVDGRKCGSGENLEFDTAPTKDAIFEGLLAKRRVYDRDRAKFKITEANIFRRANRDYKLSESLTEK